MRKREREAQKKGKPVEECITELTTTRKTDVFLHRTFEGDSELSIMGYKGSAFISPLVKCGCMSINSPIILGLHMEVLSEFPTGVLQPLLFRKQEVHIAGRGRHRHSLYALQIWPVSTALHQLEEEVEPRGLKVVPKRCLIHHAYPDGSPISISSLKLQTHISTAYTILPLVCLLKTCSL